MKKKKQEKSISSLDATLNVIQNLKVVEDWRSRPVPSFITYGDIAEELGRHGVARSKKNVETVLCFIENEFSNNEEPCCINWETISNAIEEIFPRN